MTETEALHTAARRYSQDRARMWRESYGEWNRAIMATGRRWEEELSRRQQKALSLYHRYQVVDAILVEVESFVPNDLGDLEEARSLLCLAGQTADDTFTEKNTEETARQ